MPESLDLRRISAVPPPAMTVVHKGWFRVEERPDGAPGGSHEQREDGTG